MERALLIIAEVGYRLQGDIELLCPGPLWRGIRDLGNLIRHGDEAVINSRIWETVSGRPCRTISPLRSAVIKAMERRRAIP